MKKSILSFSLLMLAALTSCRKEMAASMEPQIPTTQFAAVAATPAPAITEVKSSETSISTPYSGYLGIDSDGATIITIKGQNFGNQDGTVAFTGTQTSGYSIISTIWGATEINLTVKSALSCVPTTTTTTAAAIAKLKITTRAGQSLSKQVSLVPTVSGKGYGQSPWYTSKRRREAGFSAQPRGASYSGTGISGSIDGNYIPAIGDICISVAGMRQFYVEKVTPKEGTKTTTTKNGVKTTKWTVTYTLTMKEANPKSSGGFNELSDSGTIVVNCSQTGNNITKTLSSVTFKQGTNAITPKPDKYHR